MFGYIVPFKPELKIKDFETYKSVYCGLCHQLSKSFGPFSRLFLSYDFAFMSLFFMSLNDATPCFEKKRCISSPFRKKCCMCSGPELEYCAASAATLVDFKNQDGVADSGFFGALPYRFLRLITKRPAKSVQRTRPELYETVEHNIHLQAQVEASPEVTFDMAAEPTAAIVSFLAADRARDEDERRILARFGYFLGRLIYMFDAADDYFKDKKKSRFNPYLRDPQYCTLTPKQLSQRLKESFNGTIAELIAAYQLLTIRKNKEILDNFIFLGFKSRFTQVLNQFEGEQHDGSI